MEIPKQTQEVLDGSRRWTVECADALEFLKCLPSESVNMCCTSPPYWGLRDYGVVGQYGLEKTLTEYIATMTTLFGELRRVLRKDGVCFVNMGDSFSNFRSQMGPPQTIHDGDARGLPGLARRRGCQGLKEKDLIGQPWMLAFALRADGWYLRQDIIWHKPNPMPESITDRCTRSHEYVFMFSKSKRYHYDADAIRTNWTSGRDDMREKGLRTGTAYQQQAMVADNSNKPEHGSIESRKARANGEAKHVADDEVRGIRPVKMPDGWATHKGGHGSIHRGGREKGKTVDLKEDSQRRGYGAKAASQNSDRGANARSVWTIATEGFPGAHFATFPTELARRCILAGCPGGGIVIEPFAGSGTTLAVAVDLGCRAIGCELNPEYAAMARKRIAAVTPGMFTKEIA